MLALVSSSAWDVVVELSWQCEDCVSCYQSLELGQGIIILQGIEECKGPWSLSALVFPIDADFDQQCSPGYGD